MSEETPKKNLRAKLAEAMAECAYVAKGSRNTQQNYDYTSAADVIALANRALSSRGICVGETNYGIQEYREREVNGKSGIDVVVQASVELRDADSAETARFTGIGSGRDNGDKAVMKANTAATKYMWLGGLGMAMGDDPEADSETDRPAPKAKPASRPRKASPERAPEEEHSVSTPPDADALLTSLAAVTSLAAYDALRDGFVEAGGETTPEIIEAFKAKRTELKAAAAAGGAS